MTNTNHPNPQAKRDEIVLLDGKWDFCFDDENKGLESEYFKGTNWGNDNHDKKTIKVPYVYQSTLSGIGNRDEHKIVWYKKTVKLDDSLLKNELKLHFEAVDYIASVFVNGSCVGTHEGGYAPFSFNIKPFVKAGDNLITVRVEDETSPRRILGKQSHTGKNFACWYTPNTGIWQSVYLEAHNETYVKNIRFIPHVAMGEVEVLAEIEGFNANNSVLELTINFDGNESDHPYKFKENRTVKATVHNNLARFRFSMHDICFEIPIWSPENPHLCYVDVKLTCKNGSVDNMQSYFGYRDVSIRGNQFYLNHRPYFQKLILNQAYFNEGLLTGSEEEYINDITLTKAMGFNGIRMHQKIETNRFLYLCDKMGLLYWAELPSPYSNDSFASEQIVKDLVSLVHKHANHPCVVAWTPFNESWGVAEIIENKRQQQLTLAAYHVIKALDEQHRPIISNDGWEHTKSDILTIHDYEQDAEVILESYPKTMAEINWDYSPAQVRKPLYADGFSYNNEPFLLSEYGGIAFKIQGFSNTDWGYGNTAKTIEEFYERFEAIHKAYFSYNYFCGICYTQLTDVEQEINGLLDHNHKPKFDVARIKKILDLKKTT